MCSSPAGALWRHDNGRGWSFISLQDVTVRRAAQKRARHRAALLLDRILPALHLRRVDRRAFLELTEAISPLVMPGSNTPSAEPTPLRRRPAGRRQAPGGSHEAGAASNSCANSNQTIIFVNHSTPPPRPTRTLSVPCGRVFRFRLDAEETAMHTQVTVMLSSCLQKARAASTAWESWMWSVYFSDTPGRKR